MHIVRMTDFISPSLNVEILFISCYVDYKAVTSFFVRSTFSSVFYKSACFINTKTMTKYLTFFMI